MSTIIYDISCNFFNSSELSDEFSPLVSFFLFLKIQINELEKIQIKFISLNISHLEEKGLKRRRRRRVFDGTRRVMRWTTCTTDV
jgi:hypothetical protein